ncbi:MAG: metalloenzyme [Leptospiraceae bacterium]|nr:metalloenzyme [Leptospiraceae bacterium]MDW8306344.1 metalloenzyme [Leptospiraceae bacterium]
MGVEGLPQSATGQTALFTGYNAPKILGRHMTGFPTASLRPYLLEKSILRILKEHGYKATLLNSYSKEYLEKINSPRGMRLQSASSLAQKATQDPFFTIEDYIAGRSLYMDLTNWFLRAQGYKLPMVNPKINGRKLAKLARAYDFVIFEYFFTDKAGHSQSFAASKRIIAHIDGFLEGIWEELDPQLQTIIVATDHGNLEDLSTNLHTPNPVATILYGEFASKLHSKIAKLYDIPRAIYEIFSLPFDENFFPQKKAFL